MSNTKIFGITDKYKFYITEIMNVWEYPDPRESKLYKQFPDTSKYVSILVNEKFKNNLDICRNLITSISGKTPDAIDWIISNTNELPFLIQFTKNIVIIEEKVKSNLPKGQKANALSMIANSFMIEEYEKYGNYRIDPLSLINAKIIYKELRRINFIVIKVNENKIEEFSSHLKIKGLNLSIKNISDYIWMIKIKDSSVLENFEFSYIKNLIFFHITSESLTLQIRDHLTDTLTLVTPNLKKLQIDGDFANEIVVRIVDEQWELERSKYNGKIRIEHNLKTEFFSMGDKKYLKMYKNLFM